MRVFMQLSFCGTRFHGWQIQPGEPTVQQSLEEALAKVLRMPVAVTGAGRTDAGVHARRMVAHADIPDDADIPKLLNALHALTGPDIAVESITPVKADAHARFDATLRTYRYYVTHTKTPFFREMSWYVCHPFDYEAMNEAAELLLSVSDFTSFSKLHTDAKTNICRVSHARWHRAEGDFEPGEWYFEISADRFLRNMVRAIVGTLAEVGRGKMTVHGFRHVINALDRCAAGSSAPARGLYLWDVAYPASLIDLPGSTIKSRQIVKI